MQTVGHYVGKKLLLQSFERHQILKIFVSDNIVSS